MATTWWFRRQRGVPSGTIDERFTNLADRVSEAAGRWQVTAFSFVLFVLWLSSGPHYGWSDTWQLIANTPTTWAELWLGLFTLAAANRIDRRNWVLHQTMAQTLQHVEQLIETVATVLGHVEGLAEVEGTDIREEDRKLDRISADIAELKVAVIR